MITFSATDLDSWRDYLNPPFEHWEMTTEQLIGRLLRTEPANAKMLMGTAFHTVLEGLHRTDVEIEQIEQDGYEFFFEIDKAITLPQLSEQRVSRIYDTPSGPVLLKGRYDRRDGNMISDYKLTFDAFDAERYADQMQWRAYLDMTGATQFRHIVFQANEKHSPNIFVYDVHDFNQWTYPALHNDVADCVAELADFVRKHVPQLCGLAAA